MRKFFKFSLTIALLALTACSPHMLEEAVMVEDPIVMAEPAAPVKSKLSCGTAGLDDGIGGTGCPVID